MLAKFLNAVTVASHSLNRILSTNITKYHENASYYFTYFLPVSVCLKKALKASPGAGVQHFNTHAFKILENSQINLPAKLCNRIMTYSSRVQQVGCFFLSFFERGKKTCHDNSKKFCQYVELA